MRGAIMCAMEHDANDRGQRGFRGLRAWQEASALHGEISDLTARFPEGHAKLAEQMRDAARSVHACIAEGAGRHTPREFARFLDMARGSLREVESDVAMLERLGLAIRREVDALERRIIHTARLIAGLLRKLRPDDR